MAAALSANRINRWYDRRPMVSHAIEMLDTMPDAVVSAVAGGISRIAEQDYQASELVRGVKSLGKDKVLALYKAQQKKRHRDNIPNYHKVMTYWSLMPETHQNGMASRVYELGDTIHQYLSLCRQYRQAVSLPVIDSLTRQYVEQGNARMDQYLEQILARFVQNAAQAEAVAIPPADARIAPGLARAVDEPHANTDPGGLRLIVDPNN